MFLSYRITSIFFFQKKKPKKCAEAALSLLTCMEESDCVMKEGKSVLDCMKAASSDVDIIDDPCKAQRNAYYICKHSQLNMRTRIRGVRVY